MARGGLKWASESLIANEKEDNLARELKIFNLHLPLPPGQEISTFEELGH